ncbi:MAG: glycosyltransferase [Abitibacteriaceae bacterium]|nr:glycosyltransferase [Abditibacteriaceae bacterium]
MQMFAEAGCSVHVLYRAPVHHSPTQGVYTGKLGSNIQLHPVGSGHSGGSSMLDFQLFVVRAMRLSRRLKPSIIIGYDLHGFATAFIAHTIHPSAKLVYHSLDVTSIKGANLQIKLLKRLEFMGARRAQHVIFPATGRADFFKSEAHLQHDPAIVKNCQRLNLSDYKRGMLNELTQGKLSGFDRIVLHLGSLGTSLAIQEIVQSVPIWRGNWALILMGTGSESYLSHIRSLVSSLNLEDQVFILPTATYDLWYDTLHSAHLGLALYKAGDINYDYMAGSGNKMGLYLKAGIPSLVPNIPDFAAFIERYRTGEVVESINPQSIAQAINKIFSDAEQYKQYCQNAKDAFASEFNFEHQYEPVLRQLLSPTLDNNPS